MVNGSFMKMNYQLNKLDFGLNIIIITMSLTHNLVVE